MSGRLITANERERAWIAKGLHDGISQHLALLTIDLDTLRQKPPEGAELSVQLEKLHRRANEMLEDVRRLSHGLHPSLLDHLGLVAALNNYCRETQQSTNISIRFTSLNIPRKLPRDVSLCLYRVAQEALQNVVKHSGADSATVDLEVKQDEIRMRIADDGSGFDMNAKRTADTLGLVGMLERVVRTQTFRGIQRKCLRRCYTRSRSDSNKSSNQRDGRTNSRDHRLTIVLRLRFNNVTSQQKLF